MLKKSKIVILASDRAHKSLLIISITFFDKKKLGKLKESMKVGKYVKTWKKSISKFHFSVKL